MGISYKPLKRKHTNYNLLSKNFLKEMYPRYALAFLLVGFILSVNGQDANEFEGRPEAEDPVAKVKGIICGSEEHKACAPACQCQKEDTPKCSIKECIESGSTPEACFEKCIP